MKRIIISVAFSCLCLNMLAQSSLIFYGGQGDGHVRVSYLQPIINANAGASGDGWKMTSYLQTVINSNKGGLGDGWMFNNHQPIVVNSNKGGMADGWARMSYLQPIVNSNAGGLADGWSFNKNTTITTAANKGGLGDGWASTYTAVLPLPVLFLKFYAVKQGWTSLLNWEMADDKPVLSFEVERSANAVGFTKVGDVMQDDRYKMKYQFVDQQPMKGYNYYRIKMVMANGESEYTNTRLVRFDDVVAQTMRVYPNPVYEGTVTIELPQSYSGKNVVVNVFNSGGIIVLQKKVLNNTGSQIIINTSGLTNGSYTVQMASDDEHATAKLAVLNR